MREGWIYKNFAEVFDLQMGKTPSRDNPLYWNGQNTWVSISDIQHKYIDSSKENITDKAVSESNIKIVKKGTVIMSFKLSVGRCTIAAKDLFTNEAIMAFTPIKGGIVLPDFVYYYLKGYKWIGANKAVMGMTLNKKSISTNVFAYPSLSEQQRIVSELDLLSNIIEKKKEQLKAYDQLAQSIFYDMFGDPIENPKGWEVKKLGDCLSYIKNGANIKQTKEASGIPITRIETLSGGIFNRDRLGYANIFSTEKYSQYIMDDGDILMSHINSKTYIGRAVLYKKKDNELIIHGMNLLRLKVITSLLSSIYMCYFFKSDYFRDKVARIRKDAVNQSSMAISDLIKIHILLPPLFLQQSFAEKIEAIEKQKTLVQQSIVETQTMFNSRMDCYFN